ncbi:MAG: PrsW family glutamic-type intramembrane protease [Chloroflexota bacterium]
MMGNAGRDWRVALLAVVSGGIGLLALALAVSASAYAVVGPWIGRKDSDSPDPLGVIVLSGALALVGVLMLVASYYALRALRLQPDRAAMARPIRIWEASILLLVWLASSILAQLFLDQPPWRWVTPFLHLLAIGTPVYLLLKLAIGGIQGGSRLRLWGSLVAGLILGTGFAAAAELTLLVLAVSAGGLYLVFNPEQMHMLESLAFQLGQAARPEDALVIIEPFLVRPLAFLVVLLAVSGVAPVVEELAKSAAPWAIYDRLITPAQGFWSGAVSGAGFALFEGLVASADAKDGWAFILMIRAGSSMMHILAAALAGWGIAAFRNGHRVTHLLGGYALAIGMHAFWNAAVVAMAYGGLRLVFSGGEMDMVGLATVVAGALVLMVSLAFLPFALILINRALRTARAGSASQRPTESLETAPTVALKG